MTADVIRESVGVATVLPPETISCQELEHRVANSLQLISSLLSLQAKQAADVSAREALGAAAHRIGAVGAIHKQLHRSNSPRSIDIACYLFDLAETFEQGFGGGAGRKQIGVHVQGRMVSPDFARVLGILTTEIVIHACKHAYAPDEPGDIDIYLFFPAKTDFRMEVRDYVGKTGDREPASPAGLGADIIDAMCHKLNATCACLVDDKGSRFLIRGTVL